MHIVTYIVKVTDRNVTKYVFSLYTMYPCIEFMNQNQCIMTQNEFHKTC